MVLPEGRMEYLAHIYSPNMTQRPVMIQREATARRSNGLHHTKEWKSCAAPHLNSSQCRIFLFSAPPNGYNIPLFLHTAKGEKQPVLKECRLHASIVGNVRSISLPQGSCSAQNQGGRRPKICREFATLPLLPK